MNIGESEEDARSRLGLSAGSAVLFIQRVIIKGEGHHAQQ